MGYTVLCPSPRATQRIQSYSQPMSPACSADVRSPFRRDNTEGVPSKVDSPWNNRKKAMRRLSKTLPTSYPSFGSISDESCCCSNGSCSSWEQRRTGLMRSSAGQSPRSPRVRRVSRPNTPKTTEKPTLCRWESEPKLARESSEVAPKSESTSKMCRWQSSPCISPQARRPARRGDSDRVRSPSSSPRLPPRSNSAANRLVTSPFRRPAQPKLSFEREKNEASRELEQLKQKMKAYVVKA